LLDEKDKMGTKIKGVSGEFTPLTILKLKVKRGRKRWI